jgi:hypothetical protein
MKPIRTELNAFAELIPGVSALTNKNLNLVNTAKDLITTPLSRWFNLITWKDPRGAYEVILGMAKRGVNKEVSARLLSYLLANALLIPALISLIKTWGDQINASAKSTYLVALNKLCDEKIITSGCTEIKQELSNIKFMFSEDYVKNYLAALPLDLGKMFGGESWDDAEQLINENRFFMTYWDDIVNQIWNLVQGSPFPFIGRPKANKILKILEDVNSKAAQDLVKLGINPNADDLEQEIINYYKTHTKPEDRAKVDEVIDSVKDTDNSPTIDTFYNYIYSLDNRVGKDDLPYMKQDSTNKNKFTFEACLNPPDCNQTELRTYVFDGTTFVKQ